MIGIDTNILARYITRDEEKQFRAAKDVLENQCSDAEPGFINVVVLSELTWVLSRAYHAGREQVAAVVEQLLVTSRLEIQHRDACSSALAAYRDSDVEFADCLIGQLNHREGCETTYTLDRRGGSLAGFSIP